MKKGMRTLYAPTGPLQFKIQTHLIYEFPSKLMVSLSADACAIAITFLSLLGMYPILCLLYEIAF